MNKNINLNGQIFNFPAKNKIRTIIFLIHTEKHKKRSTMAPLLSSSTSSPTSLAASMNGSPEKTHQAFRNALPLQRLGTEHSSLKSFTQAAKNVATPSTNKEYSLIVVTEPAKQRILLGKKHRGFGMGMFNSFGGKLEPGESATESAKRELEEETGIDVPMERMTDSQMGTLRFTFQDSPMEMIVHAFRINVSCNDDNGDQGGANNEQVDKKDDDFSPPVFRLDPKVIRGCEEITPVWFADWHDIPLQNMHADDSVWLTRVLTSFPTEPVLVDGRFHFAPGGPDVNSVSHYHVDIRSK